MEFIKDSRVFKAEGGSMGDLILGVVGAFAGTKRFLIRERQREGIALSKQRGAYWRRKRSSCRRKRPARQSRQIGAGLDSKRRPLDVPRNLSAQSGTKAGTIKEVSQCRITSN